MADNGKRSVLDSIPGWGGYRNRERRRESDRLIRERLARDYGEIADRLGRLAARLAADRKLRSIRYVDQPHGRLNHFIDRLRTATYGYSGLFSDRAVDAAALDQIAAFDTSLADSIAEIDRAARALEDTDADSDAFRERSDELSTLIESLLNRFNRRGELIDTGEARPEPEIAELLTLSPAAGAAPTAYQLHDGDAVTFRNVNYRVVGRITITTDDGTWRDFQLQGGDGASWLHVPGSAAGPFRWYRQVAIEGEAGAQQVLVNDTSYELAGSIDGTSEVIGTGGSSGNREMTAYTYRQDTGGGVLCVYHWRADRIAFAGEEIDAAELELWSREGGRAV